MPIRENGAGADSKESNWYITASDINIFSYEQSLPKREGVYIHTRLPRLAGGSPAITDGMEDETEQINGMGSVDSTHVCNLLIHLREYKDYFLGGV